MNLLNKSVYKGIYHATASWLIEAVHQYMYLNFYSPLLYISDRRGGHQRYGRGGTGVWSAGDQVSNLQTEVSATLGIS